MEQVEREYYAGLWQKLMRVATTQGCGRWVEGRDHKHMGIEFKNGVPCEETQKLLKSMVQYIAYDDRERCDANAMCALLNFEEVRWLGRNAFALTTTYNGAYGLRSADSTARKQHSAQADFIRSLLEFEEL